MVQSVGRAFAILGAVASQPAGVTSIAEQLGLPKSTVSRLLGSLERLGAVERLDRARYGVGPAVAALASTVSAERSIAAAVRPELVHLVRAVGETAGLAFPGGYEVRYVDQVESDNAVQVRDWTGTRAPLHAAPSGLVLLAHWPPEAIDGYIAHGLERLTPGTMTDPERLRSRLGDIRRDGFAWGREEFVEGINSVAAAVRDQNGKTIAALHCHGPAYRFPVSGREGWVAEQVVKAADGASAQLALG